MLLHYFHHFGEEGGRKKLKMRLNINVRPMYYKIKWVCIYCNENIIIMSKNMKRAYD